LNYAELAEPKNRDLILTPLGLAPTQHRQRQG